MTGGSEVVVRAAHATRSIIVEELTIKYPVGLENAIH
jgi:hypothetical protein